MLPPCLFPTTFASIGKENETFQSPNAELKAIVCYSPGKPERKVKFNENLYFSEGGEPKSILKKKNDGSKYCRFIHEYYI